MQVKTSIGHTFTSLAHAISKDSDVAHDLDILFRDLFQEINEAIVARKDYKFNAYLLDHSTHSSESIIPGEYSKGAFSDKGSLKIKAPTENMCQWGCGNEGSPMIFMGDPALYCGECQEE